jgi:hypothetical protein
MIVVSLKIGPLSMRTVLARIRMPYAVGRVGAVGSGEGNKNRMVEQVVSTIRLRPRRTERTIPARQERSELLNL